MFGVAKCYGYACEYKIQNILTDIVPGNPKDGGDVFLKYVVDHPQDCVASQHYMLHPSRNWLSIWQLTVMFIASKDF